MEKMLKLAETYEYNNDFKNALGVYIRIQSNEPHILNKIGMCYFRLNKFEMAIKNFEKILPLLKNPIPDLLNNIGFCYSKIRDYETALKYYTQSNNIKHNKNNYKILGDIYFYMKKYDLSIKYYNKAGDNNIILYNKCFPYLAQKNFKIGFELYEYRLQNNYNEQTKMNTRVDIPNIDYWDGIKPCNRLLIVYEQGIGDNIMYYRFIIELSLKYPNMIIDYFCKDIVRHLFYTKICNIDNINLIDNVILSLYNYKLYIMSLPKILEITDIIPNSINYIKVNEEKLELWTQKLSKINKFKIGIVNNGLLSSFIEKDIPFEYFKKISELNVELFLLDKNNSKYEIDINEPFEDTICILKNIDLLITIDTSIVHLAGIMNINTWLLLGYSSDWRWSNDDYCYWYKNVTFIRMKENKPFFNILDLVYNKLLEIL